MNRVHTCLSQVLASHTQRVYVGLRDNARRLCPRTALSEQYMFPFASHSQSVCRLQHVGRPLVLACFEQSLSRKKSVMYGVCRVRGVGGDGTNLAHIVCMYVCKYVCIETTELPTQQCGSSVISFQQNCGAAHLARGAMSDRMLPAAVGTVASKYVSPHPGYPGL